MKHHQQKRSQAERPLETHHPTPREVLRELFELLEEYAPIWYTEAHHNRAVAALQMGSGDLSNAS